METINIPKTISTLEIAEELGLSEQRVRTMLRLGHIQGQLAGNQWLVSQRAFDQFKKNSPHFSPPDKIRDDYPLPKIKALSFFSGAMGLDLGLERAGIHSLLASEIDKASRQTIATNRPDMGLIGDIWQYSATDVRRFARLADDDEIDVIVGGPPCQAFSTAGARKGFDDDRGNAFLRYLELIIELNPRYAVIENVRGLLSAPIKHRPHSERDEGWDPSMDEKAGGALLHILSILRNNGYTVSFNLYNAANFGVPQVRERVVLICTKSATKVPHLMPTHAQHGHFDLPQWRTLKDAIANTTGCDHVDFPESRLKYYRMLTEGQYWKHLPPAIQKEALGNSYFSGGGKTGFLRRLAWDKPACTLVTTPDMPATDICHPEEDRPISVQEYKRIQQFPDEWEVRGSIKDQYKQIGNAVPVGLGEAIGKALVNHMSGINAQPPHGFPFSRYKCSDELSWEESTRKTPAQRQ